MTPRHPQHRFLRAPAASDAPPRSRLPAPPGVLEAAAGHPPTALATEAARLDLRAAVADHHQVDPAAVLLAPDVERLVAAFVQLSLGPDERAAVALPARAATTRAILVAGARYVDVGRTAAFDHQGAFLERVLADGDVRLVALGRPSVTAGAVAPLSHVEAAADAGAAVLVDEVQAPCAVPAIDSAVHLATDRPGIVVLADTAELLGLGPLGLGWLLAHPDTVALVARALGAVALGAGAVAASHAALPHRLAHGRRLAALRVRLERALAAAPGWQVLPGQGLTVLARPPGGPRDDVPLTWRGALRLDVPGNEAAVDALAAELKG